MGETLIEALNAFIQRNWDRIKNEGIYVSVSFSEACNYVKAYEFKLAHARGIFYVQFTRPRACSYDILLTPPFLKTKDDILKIVVHFPLSSNVITPLQAFTLLAKIFSSVTSEQVTKYAFTAGDDFLLVIDPDSFSV